MFVWEQLTYSVLPLLGVVFDLRKPIRDIAAFHRLGLSQHRFGELIFLLFRHEQHVLEFWIIAWGECLRTQKIKQLTLTTFSVLMSSCASFLETRRRQLFSPFVFRSANRSAIEPLLAIEFDICEMNECFLLCKVTSGIPISEKVMRAISCQMPLTIQLELD